MRVSFFFVIACVLVVEGEVVVVTGGTSGIGESVTRFLAARGAKVFFSGRREAKGFALERELTLKGHVASYFPGDVTNHSSNVQLVSRVVGLYGKIDGLFANAGYEGSSEGLFDLPFEDMMRVVATNNVGLLDIVRLCVAVMLQHKHGVVVINSSIAGSIHREVFKLLPPTSLSMTYAFSKAGADAIGRSLATFFPAGVKSFILKPAVYRTDMVDRTTHPSSEFGKFVASTTSQNASFGTRANGFAKFNPIFPGRAGSPLHVAKIVSAMFDLSTKFQSGDEVICDHEFTLLGDDFGRALYGPSPFVVSSKSIRNFKGELLDWTREVLERKRAEYHHDEL